MSKSETPAAGKAPIEFALENSTNGNEIIDKIYQLVASYGGRAKKVSTFVYGSYVTYRFVSGIIKNLQSRKNVNYSLLLKIDGDEFIYPCLMAWITQHVNIKQVLDQRHEMAASAHGPLVDRGRDRGVPAIYHKAEGDENEEDFAEGLICSPKDVIRFLPTGGFCFDFEGVNVYFETANNDALNKVGEMMEVKTKFWTPSVSLRFNTTNRDVIYRFIYEVAALGLQKREHVPYVKVWQWGSWENAKPCPQSNRVILPMGQYEELSSDLNHFLENKAWYESVQIPYRRGYLFHGIPGSGKTTLAASVASDFGLNLCLMDISKVSQDDFHNALRRLPGKSILHLEDVDAAFTKDNEDDGEEDQQDKTQRRLSANPTLTLSTMLNGLDGLMAPEDRILTMTTNHIERIDHALIRPGRVDHMIKFEAAKADQILRLALRFKLPEGEANDLAKKWERDGVGMAEIQNRLIKKCRLDASASTPEELGRDLIAVPKARKRLVAKKKKSAPKKAFRASLKSIAFKSKAVPIAGATKAHSG